MKIRKIKKYYKRGLKYLKQKDFREYINYYDKRIPNKCFLPSVLIDKGIYYAKNGLDSKAVKIIEKALKFNTEVYEIYLNVTAQLFNELSAKNPVVECYSKVYVANRRIKICNIVLRLLNVKY